MPSREQALRLAQSPPPRLERRGALCTLHGDWTLAALRPRILLIRVQLRLAAGPDHTWDLSDVSRLDAFGALLLWRCWGEREPETLVLPPALHGAFDRIRHASGLPMQSPQRDWLAPLVALGRMVLSAKTHVVDLVEMVGHVTLEALLLFRHPRDIPWREMSASMYKAGVQAMPICALLGFLIGVVLSYLVALQLQNFGADQLIINILGFGIIRELGPMLVSVLVAGRSGSAITAQLGVMRVTEEIDALSTMGISPYQRLVLPKVVALALTMPLLVLWTSAAALAGGMMAAHFQVNLDFRYFAATLPQVVQIANVYIGLSKGLVFGLAIGLISCHYGLRVKPNTESLSRNTTASVVTAITAVIALDAVLAIVTRTVGVVAR